MTEPRITYHVGMSLPIQGSAERALMFSRILVDISESEMAAPDWVDSSDNFMSAGWDFFDPGAAQQMHDWLVPRAVPKLMTTLSVETYWPDPSDLEEA